MEIFLISRTLSTRKRNFGLDVEFMSKQIFEMQKGTLLLKKN